MAGWPPFRTFSHRGDARRRARAQHDECHQNFAAWGKIRRSESGVLPPLAGRASAGALDRRLASPRPPTPPLASPGQSGYIKCRQQSEFDRAHVHRSANLSSPRTGIVQISKMHPVHISKRIYFKTFQNGGRPAVARPAALSDLGFEQGLHFIWKHIEYAPGSRSARAKYHFDYTFPSFWSIFEIELSSKRPLRNCADQNAKKKNFSEIKFLSSTSSSPMLRGVVPKLAERASLLATRRATPR